MRNNCWDNWYACFSCQVAAYPLPPTDQIVGGNLGLTTFATLSNGEGIRLEHWMKRGCKGYYPPAAQKENRPKGSPERKQAVHALQHAYQRQTNRRENFAHQASRKLVNNYQFIAFEGLKTQAMQSNGNKIINRGIADVAWDQFVQFTTYKAVEAGRGVARVDPKNTTQMYSGCGAMVPKDLSVRNHACPHCGLERSRDHNAALNNLTYGLASFRPCPIEAARTLAPAE